MVYDICIGYFFPFFMSANCNKCHYMPTSICFLVANEGANFYFPNSVLQLGSVAGRRNTSNFKQSKEQFDSIEFRRRCIRFI
jgi:hypothetical protein